MARAVPPPTAVAVGPHAYAVHFDRDRLEAYDALTRRGHWGYTDHNALEIVVHPGVHPSRQRETVWHEVKHAVACVTSWDGALREEAAIVRTAALELAVLRANPALTAWLVAGD